MCRRVLIVAVMVISFWAAPAAAQVIGDPVGNYPPTVSPTSLVSVPTTTVPPGDVDDVDDVDDADGADQADGDVEAAETRGGLARTGADDIAPLIQAAIVLMGAGTLLVLVARRRRAMRRAAA